MNKTIKYTIRVNDKMDNYIKKRAEKWNCSISEYIRQLIAWEMRVQEGIENDIKKQYQR